MGYDDNLEEDMDNIDCDTAAVMKERAATSTCDGYERRNINFMIWFFDNLKKYPNLLEPTIASQMEAACAKYSQRRTKNDRPSKSMVRSATQDRKSVALRMVT